MIHPNGHDPSTTTIPAPVPSETSQAPSEMPPPAVQPLDIATRAKLRAREHFQQNRFVIIGAGALVVALLTFVATSTPHKSSVQKTKVGTAGGKEEPTQVANAGADRRVPIGSWCKTVRCLRRGQRSLGRRKDRGSLFSKDSEGCGKSFSKRNRRGGNHSDWRSARTRQEKDL